MKPCIFCGTQPADSKEHVIPQWARRLFDEHGPVRVTVSAEPKGEANVPVRQLQHLNMTLTTAICQRCNNGFLAGMETPLEPILTPMILEASFRSLSPTEQAMIATWAVKTVLLFELSARQRLAGSRPIEGYVASQAELAWLYAKKSPPPRSLVWLTCWNCQFSTRTMYQPANAPLPSPKGTVMGHMTTFALGFLTFQVFSVDFLAADEAGARVWNPGPPASMADHVVRIWPTQSGSVDWPRAAVPYGGWNRLVSWDGVLIRKPSNADAD